LWRCGEAREGESQKEFMSLNLFAHSMIQSDCCERVRRRERGEAGGANLCKMYFTLKTLPYCFANCAFSSLEAMAVWPRGEEPVALNVVLELAVL
jgi:hypothetical protein